MLKNMPTKESVSDLEKFVLKLARLARNFQGTHVPMADFGVALALTEILLPLGEKHILSPNPPDAHFGNRRVSEM